tara:strand:- start:15805 stop:17199 length:1395 start_codon:yes stop_codon:yes gene_type:complete
MKNIYTPLVFALLMISGISSAQDKIEFNEDSTFIRAIFDEALVRGEAYENLRSLCKDVGPRLTGSASAEVAIHWGVQRLQNYGFDTVYKQEIQVPHWERGTTEQGWFKTPEGELNKVNLLALGGSIGTEGVLESEIIMFKDRDALLAADQSEIEGKIVFIAQPMNQKLINTFRAYGGCYPVRGHGAADAGKKGAVGVIIRSLSISEHEHAHTGTMRYEDGVTKIPAAAISTKDATKLEKMITESDEPFRFVMEMDCQKYPDMTSYNVIAEIKGAENPEQIITVGGHLDSWDVGEGAHDDGAGIVHSMEALRILKELNYQPKNTLRVVFFMNEENGNKGGKSYAKYAKESGQKHIAAIESDRGGFAPRGFDVDGSSEHLELLQSFTKLLKPYYLHHFEKGYGGVDIGPLKDEFDSIALYGFVPDSQRYFDFHHNHNDVFENVNKRELHMGAGSICSLIYLLDKYL